MARAVEAEDDFRHDAKNSAQVFASCGGAERGDRVPDAVGGQHDDVHIALDNQQPFQLAFRTARLEQAIQLPALVKDRGFR